MAKRKRMIKVESIPLALGQKTTREMPKTVYRGLMLRIAVTHTNGGTSPGLTPEIFSTIVRKIGVVINGMDHPVEISLYQLFAMNYLDMGVAPEYSFHNDTGTEGTSHMTVYLPFELLRAVRPVDTLLNCLDVSSVVFEVSWGQSWTNTSGLSGAIEIQTVEYEQVNPAENYARHTFAYTSESIVGTGTKTIQLETKGENQYRRIILFTKDDTGTLSNNIIDNIAFKTRSHYFYDVPTNIMHPYTKAQYGIEPLTGVYPIEFTSDGMMSQRYVASNWSDFLVEIDSLVSAGSVEILRERAIYAQAAQ